MTTALHGCCTFGLRINACSAFLTHWIFMKNTRFVRPLPLLGLSIAALLTACGGGGGGGGSSTSSTSTTPYTLTLANDGYLKATTSHAVGNEASVTGITQASAFPASSSYGSSYSLNSYVLDNGSKTMAIDTSTVNSGNVLALSANAGKQKAYVGGSTWNYARFGQFIDKTPNSNGLNSEYTQLSMSFLRFHDYKNYNVSTTTYNLPGSKAVSMYVTESTQVDTVTCDVSVALTVAGKAQTADITLSGCDGGVSTTGFVRATKASPETGGASLSVGAFGATTPGGVFTASSGTFFYGIAGPNNTELVGQGTIRGTTMVGGTARTTVINLVLGARK
jgi:hypothetical protein